jgi:Ni/Co efflux regulator RcnB
MKQLLTVLFAALFAAASLNAVAADEKKSTQTEVKKDAQDQKKTAKKKKAKTANKTKKAEKTEKTEQK